jgi:hypothetical protein
MSAVYNKGKYSIGSGSLIWTSDTFKVALVTSSYTFNADHPFLDSGSGANNPKTNEVSTGTGYARKTLASKTTTQDDTNDRIIYAAADVTYTTPNTWTAAAAVVFHDTGVDTTCELICFLDGGGFPKTMNGTDFLIAWAATGVFKLT